MSSETLTGQPDRRATFRGPGKFDGIAVACDLQVSNSASYRAAHAADEREEKQKRHAAIRMPRGTIGLSAY